MVGVPPARFVWPLVAVAAVAIAIATISLALVVGDPVGPLFRQPITVPLMLALFVWALLAGAARRLTVGKLPTVSVNSRAVFFWGASRFALLMAVVLVLAISLVSFAIGLEIAGALLRGSVLLIVVTGFTGLGGGAFLNSALAVKHWRRT
jgi:hypothetical protein